ncbi:MAG: peptidoglycan-associated lipoprotein Pal [Phenylobacterium zucineum]|nr:MAG: peptidoglycan-associated lipoprotein Pal [Phenylobacterium zucineum]
MTSTIRILLVATAVSAALAACATKPKPAPAVAEAPPAAPSTPVTEMPPAPTAPVGPVRGSQEDLAATAGDLIYFALDSEAIEAEARETLRAQAAWLAANPDVRARIAGNADERGTREYNLALGARRAAATRQALIGLGVSASRLETISYGKERPLDPASTEEAWARNRNAHTVVIGLATQ